MFFILTKYQMTICNVKMVTSSNKLVEKNLPTLLLISVLWSLICFSGSQTLIALFTSHGFFSHKWMVV